MVTVEGPNLSHDTNTFYNGKSLRPTSHKFLRRMIKTLKNTYNLIELYFTVYFYFFLDLLFLQN